MRWLPVAALLVACAAPALAEPSPFAAPDILGAAPRVDAPPPMGPADARSTALPRVAAPVVGTGAAAAPVRAAPLAQPITDVPPVSLPGPMGAPSVEGPRPMTVPALDPMSAGAPRFTTGEDVAREAASIAENRRARAARQAQAAAPAAAGNRSATPPTSGINVPAAAAQPGEAAPDAAATPSAPPPAQAAAAGRARPRGCESGGDLAVLLSPACLDTLRDLRPAAGGFPMAAPAAPSPAPRTIQCAVAIFGAGGTGAAPSSFAAESLEQCFAMGARLSYGIPGLSNITAADPNMGIVAVTCRRDGPGAQAISCAAQQ